MNFDDTPHSGDFYVSCDRNLLDEAFVIREIRATKWGAWRSPVVVLNSIERSLCFGLYQRRMVSPDHEDFPLRKDPQVGFGRVVTDYCTFAWICDIVVTKEHRGKGLGTFMMRAIMANDQVAPRACLLRAEPEARGIYEKFGFVPVDAMRRLPAKTRE